MHTDQIEYRNCQAIAHLFWMREGEEAMRIFGAGVGWHPGVSVRIRTEKCESARIEGEASLAAWTYLPRNELLAFAADLEADVH
jgi:hypothetical protein